MSEVPDERALILTLRLDAESQHFFNSQRTMFFPSALNHLDAHVTLFHHLPGVELQQVRKDLEQACRLAAFQLQLTGLRSLGRGVAYTLEASALSELRGKLATVWSAWLTPQDRQKFKPHITVQNKVEPDEARNTLELLQATFQERQIHATGLDLWRYEGGPWTHLHHFPFS